MSALRLRADIQAPLDQPDKYAAMRPSLCQAAKRIGTTKGHYIRLAAMAVLSFVSMYVLMYAMVDRFTNVYPNFNQFMRSFSVPLFDRRSD
jgi:hypothetical protein